MADLVDDALSNLDSSPIQPAPNTKATEDRAETVRFTAPSVESSARRGPGRPRKDEAPVYDEFKYEKPKYRKGALVKPMTDLYITVSMGVMAFDPKCGEALASNAASCAEQWDLLAQRNPAVRDALMRLTQASAIGGLVVAHMPIVLAIMAHHGPSQVAQMAGLLSGMDDGDQVE